ncbi:MAG: hypothetical protein AB7G06_04745 [Bdellovibrionales bacterium]
MQIDWKPLSRADMAKGLGQLQKMLGDVMPANGDFRLRRAALTFYPAMTFYEVTDQAHNPPRQLYALIDEAKEEVTVLDMTNQPVYKLNNEGYLKLSDATVIPYVAFFFSCVAGPYGLMPVIEKLDLPQGQEPDDETATALEGVKDVIPPTVMGEEEGGYRVGAALLFQGAVFKTEIVVNDAGVIRVDKHELALASGDGEAEGAEGAEGANENGTDKPN